MRTWSSRADAIDEYESGKILYGTTPYFSTWSAIWATGPPAEHTNQIDSHIPLSTIAHWGLVQERDDPRIFVLVSQIDRTPFDCQLRDRHRGSHLLKVVIRLFEFIVEEQVVLRQLEISKVQFLDDVVSQHVGCRC